GAAQPRPSAGARADGRRRRRRARRPGHGAALGLLRAHRGSRLLRDRQRRPEQAVQLHGRGGGGGRGGSLRAGRRLARAAGRLGDGADAQPPRRPALPGQGAPLPPGAPRLRPRLRASGRVGGRRGGAPPVRAVGESVEHRLSPRTDLVPRRRRPAPHNPALGNLDLRTGREPRRRLPRGPARLPAPWASLLRHAPYDHSNQPRIEMKRSMCVSLLSLFFLFAAGCAEEEALCPDGESSCDGTCVDTMHDPLHCGGCGIACAAGEFCIEGVCGCPDGEPSCAPENPDLFGLCFQAGQMVPLSKEHGLRVGTPLSGMEGPQTMARLDEDHVVVVGSMDQTLRVVDRRTMRIVGAHTFAAEAGPTMPNHVIVDGDRAYVTLSGTNEVAVVDLQERADPRVAYTVSTGEGTNPYFVAKADDTLYVSLWIANAVLPIRVGHDSGEAKSAIPIEGEIEGLAYPAGVAVAGGRVYAALNNLDDNFAPAGNGRLWSYDPASDAQEFVDLGPDCKNPGYVA